MSKRIGFEVTLLIEMTPDAYKWLCAQEDDAEENRGPKMPMWRAGKRFVRKLSRIVDEEVKLVEWRYKGTGRK